MNTGDHNHCDQRRFRIRVDGRLPERFSNGLSGIAQEDGPEGTILTGEFVDMAQLRSMIDYLLGLGIDVLHFEADPPQRDETN